MKKVLLLFVICFIVHSCSNDDDGNATITFLERHAGSVWQESGSDEFYLRFINNVNTPLENWFLWDNCYEYELASFDDVQTTITVNANNTFEVETIEFDGVNEYRDIVTLTISGNSLELSYEYYEDGELYASGSEFLTASLIDVDSLNICD